MDMGIGKSQFVAKTQQLYKFLIINIINILLLALV